MIQKDLSVILPFKSLPYVGKALQPYLRQLGILLACKTLDSSPIKTVPGSKDTEEIWQMGP